MSGASYLFEDDLRPRTPFVAIYACENRYSGSGGEDRGTIFVVVDGFGRVGTFAKTETHNGGTKNIEDKHLKPMVKHLKPKDKNLRHFGNLRVIVSPQFFRKFKSAVVTKCVGLVSKSSADASQSVAKVTKCAADASQRPAEA